MVDFKTLAWVTSFFTQASREFIYFFKMGIFLIIIPWSEVITLCTCLSPHKPGDADQAELAVMTCLSLHWAQLWVKGRWGRG